jgi:PAS domain-containing protein
MPYVPAPFLERVSSRATAILYCKFHVPVLCFFMLQKALSCWSSDMLDKLLKDPRFLPELFETMRDGLMVVDSKGIIRLFNRAAEEITGYRKEEVIGIALLKWSLCGRRMQNRPIMKRRHQTHPQHEMPDIVG